MISTSIPRIALRIVAAALIAVFFTWLFEGPKFVAIVLYFIAYTSFLVADIAEELNERLKALGGFIDGDDGFDEHDASV